ncbi:hypothetical protein EV424DRAFT_1345155 [Suillus variegatus]|nr:hypothetical protein EV424DRAFT_1345155 [Suillus variegatus]
MAIKTNLCAGFNPPSTYSCATALHDPYSIRGDEDGTVLAGAHGIVANATGDRLEDIVLGYVTWMRKSEVFKNSKKWMAKPMRFGRMLSPAAAQRQNNGVGFGYKWGFEDIIVKRSVGTAQQMYNAIKVHHEVVTWCHCNTQGSPPRSRDMVPSQHDRHNADKPFAVSVTTAPSDCHFNGLLSNFANTWSKQYIVLEHRWEVNHTMSAVFRWLELEATCSLTRLPPKLYLDEAETTIRKVRQKSCENRSSQAAYHCVRQDLIQ